MTAPGAWRPWWTGRARRGPARSAVDGSARGDGPTMRPMLTPVLRLLVPALAVIAVLPAADGTPEPILTNSPTRRLPLGNVDLATVASANLYVTSDGGA